MSNLEKQKELAKEAVKLIKEFKKEASIVSENSFKSIKIKKGGSIIEIDDFYEGIREYNLNEISSVLEFEMRGFGPCSAGFYEAIEEEESNIKSDFNKYTKNEFKKLIGNLKYVECRCEEIYNRLGEIEKEAE